MNIITLKVGPKYGPEYVNRLYNSLRRKSTTNFDFYCYTDDPEGLHPYVIKVPLHDPDQFKLQWHKLKFHQTGFGGIKPGDKCLILDIDWIITGDVTPIMDYDLPEQHFGCFRRWWSRRQDYCMINGGLQMFYMGDTNHLWEKFSADPQYWQEYYINIGEAEGPVNGEQNFIDNHVGDKRSWLPMEWFSKYKHDELNKIQQQWSIHMSTSDPFFMLGEFDERIKMVHFTESNNSMSDVKDQWIEDYWF